MSRREEDLRSFDEREREYARRDRESRANVDDRAYELLVRLDERGRAIEDDLRELRKIVVTQVEFRPVRMAVYGLIGVAGTGLIGALLGLVVNAPK